VAPVAITIESTKLAFPAVKVGETQVEFLTITLARALLIVIKLGLPPKIATKPAPLILAVL
jgi:hypothetical protein